MARRMPGGICDASTFPRGESAGPLRRTLVLSSPPRRRRRRIAQGGSTSSHQVPALGSFIVASPSVSRRAAHRRDGRGPTRSRRDRLHRLRRVKWSPSATTGRPGRPMYPSTESARRWPRARLYSDGAAGVGVTDEVHGTPSEGAGGEAPRDGVERLDVGRLDGGRVEGEETRLRWGCRTRLGCHRGVAMVPRVGSPDLRPRSRVASLRPHRRRSIRDGRAGRRTR